MWLVKTYKTYPRYFKHYTSMINELIMGWVPLVFLLSLDICQIYTYFSSIIVIFKPYVSSHTTPYKYYPPCNIFHIPCIICFYSLYIDS